MARRLELGEIETRSLALRIRSLEPSRRKGTQVRARMVVSSNVGGWNDTPWTRFCARYVVRVDAQWTPPTSRGASMPCQLSSARIERTSLGMSAGSTPAGRSKSYARAIGALDPEWNW